MMETEVVERLRARYTGIHPLIFHRSVERAKNAGELFDIIESIPDALPVTWDERKGRWIHTPDLTQAGAFRMPTAE